MTLRLPLANKHHATIIGAYGPTMTNPEEVKERFYEDLDKLIKSLSRQGKLFPLGDYNVSVGTDHTAWECVLGKTVSENATAPCAEHELPITNIVFRLPHRNRTSRIHPRSRHYHLIEFVITRRRIDSM